MIRPERIGPGWICRLAQDDGSPMPPWSAVVFIEDTSDPRIVWVKAANGTMTRRNWREVLNALYLPPIAAYEARITRAMGHALHRLGRTDEHGIIHLDVVGLYHRFAMAGASGLIDLEDLQRGGL